MSSDRFLTDIAKPWDELNALLGERLALQPDPSDVTRLAGALAVAIRHQVDAAGIKDAEANAESIEHRIVSDTADFWKHGSLRRPDRNSQFSTESFFEYEPGKGFSFIRNALFVEHASLGKHDFLNSALIAIQYWINKRRISTIRQGKVKENPPEYHSKPFLSFDPAKCVSMKQLRIGFFSKKSNGEWERVDPLEINLEIH